jgi:hypothetical protein
MHQEAQRGSLAYAAYWACEMLLDITQRVFDAYCSSSDNLRLIRHFEKGGSSSSGLEFKR